MATVDPIRRCAQTRAPKRPARTPHGTCRLSLHINGTRYAVRGLACDHSAALQCFALRKPDSVTYHVSRHPHGAECDCPDWTFNRDGLDPAGCKHVKALRAVGLLALDGQAVCVDGYAIKTDPHTENAREAVAVTDDPDWDAMYRESRANDRRERGLIPPEVAEEIARTTLVGHRP